MDKGLYVNPNTFVPLNQIRENLTSEIATREFAMGGFAGFFNFLPDPDPILRKLGMDQSVYKDLRSDEQVGPLIARRKNLTKSLDWNIEQGEAGNKEFELCSSAINLLAGNRNKVKDIISQSLNPIFFGYSVFEVVWSLIDGAFLPVKIQEKPREWFLFDGDNNLRFRTLGNFDGIILTGDKAQFSNKFILLQNEPEFENPYGDKAISRCFWPVTFKRGGMRFFSMFVEKYGMPWVFGKLPRGATREQHYDLVGRLSNMIQDAVATGPDDSSIQLIEAKGTNSADIYERYLNRCDNAISKAILTNSLSTELQKVGSRAASETGAVTIEGNLSEEDRDFPTELFNQLFKWIVDLNVGSGLYPTFEPIELEDVKQDLAERDDVLADKIGVKFSKKYIANNYNIPEEDFEISQPIAINPLPPVPPLPINPLQLQSGEQNIIKKFFNWISGKRIELSETAQIENVADKISNALPDKLLQFQIEETMKPVIELANNSNSFEEFKNNLAALYPKMKTNQIEDLATKVFFIADLEGKFSVQQENKN
ncbi:MAG: DUF935 family protein [Melioribacter sp.]|nr:DUF935 family protein [Melioribacter sp.]